MKTTAQQLKRGFTLIELIVVIAILGVLAAVLITTIDPLDKISSANDSGVISTIAQLGKGNDSFAANNNNNYVRGGATNDFAGAITDLNAAGESKFTTLTAPSGYTYFYLPTPNNCTVPSGATPCTANVFYVNLLSKKYIGGNTGTNKSYYMYANGKGCTLLNQAAAPTLASTCP